MMLRVTLVVCSDDSSPYDLTLPASISDQSISLTVSIFFKIFLQVKNRKKKKKTSLSFSYAGTSSTKIKHARTSRIKIDLNYIIYESISIISNSKLYNCVLRFRSNLEHDSIFNLKVNQINGYIIVIIVMMTMLIIIQLNFSDNSCGFGDSFNDHRKIINEKLRWQSTAAYPCRS